MKKTLVFATLALVATLALPVLAKSDKAGGKENASVMASLSPSVSPKGDANRNARALCQVQAKNTFNAAEKAARTAYLAAEKAARDQYKLAKAAAQTKDQRKTAKDAFKAADKAARTAFKTAEKAAKDAFKAAKDACKLIKPTPTPTPTVSPSPVTS